ncbi:hypothetical protein HKX48_009417 [Thoreauomyces humboldtii]|nr:hypothetical protein HKX48_009417 [Thoreauomyces humboldtii]
MSNNLNDSDFDLNAFRSTTPSNDVVDRFHDLEADVVDRFYEEAEASFRIQVYQEAEKELFNATRDEAERISRRASFTQGVFKTYNGDMATAVLLADTPSGDVPLTFPVRTAFATL